MQSSSLNPCWARIIHRLHTLGVVESSYTNSLSQFTEIGRYPQHITSADEGKSQSIDGSILWNFLNWRRGCVKSQQEGSAQGTEFSFLSSRNTSFHSLRLLEAQHDDCLRCLLQLFSVNSPHEGPIRDAQLADHSVPLNSLAHICEQTLFRANRSRCFKIDMITEGGLISKSLTAADLSIHREHVRIYCKEGKTLDFFARPISHIKTQRIGNEVHTAFYNANHLQQATLKLIA